MGIGASGWRGAGRGSATTVILLTMLVLMEMQPVVLVDDALLATRLLVVRSPAALVRW